MPPVAPTRRRRKRSPAAAPTTTQVAPPKRAAQRLPYNMVVHGLPGVGKSSFAAFSKTPRFIIGHQERGILKLQNKGLVPDSIPVIIATDWDDLFQQVDIAITSPEQTIVFDSMRIFERQCFTVMCERDFGGDWSHPHTGFYAFAKGPRTAAKREWPAFLDKLDEINLAGKDVILIGHSQAVNFENPEGADYKRWCPSIDKETWAITFAWSECTLFANYHVMVEQQGLKHKAQASTDRFLNTQWTPMYDAKSVANLSPAIPMGDSAQVAWNNFWKEMSA